MAYKVVKMTQEGRYIFIFLFFYESGIPTLENCEIPRFCGEMHNLKFYLKITQLLEELIFSM
jgi:hypothetical protein